MIVAIDHLACEVSALDAEIACLPTDHKLLFVERGLACAQEKAPFLRSAPSTHDIALIERPGKVRLELTSHPGSSVRKLAGWGEDSAGTLLCGSSDFAAETRFLCGALRAAKTASAERLLLPGGFGRPGIPLSLVPRAPAEQGSETSLDELGFSCLALICSRLEEDLSLCLRSGAYAATQPFTLTVNMRPLKIVLLRSPSGNPVELIQPLTRTTI